jgi:methionine sulfoxide reductase heme-binding subunit
MLTKPSRSGWALALWLGLAVAAASGVLAGLSADPVDGARMVIRLTARTSLVLFVLAFTASSLLELAPSPATAWLRANRRYFGVAFAFSHFVHAGAILALSQLDPGLLDSLTTPVSFIAGGIGYAVILLMFTTSFDRAVALVGPEAWRAVHTVGGWFLALFFVVNFGRRAVISPAMYWPYMVLIFAAIAIKWVAVRRRSKVRAV